MAQASAAAAWHSAERQVAAYRAAEQAAATRREWDLQRPDALRISSPARRVSPPQSPRCLQWQSAPYDRANSGAAGH